MEFVRNISFASSEFGTVFVQSVALNTAELIINLGIVCCSILLIILGVLRSSDKNNNKQEIIDLKKIPTTVEEIPRHYHFSKWMPTVIEGLWTGVLVHFGGIQALQNLAEKCGIIFETAVFTKRVIVIRDPVLVQKILSLSSFDILNKARYLYDFIFIDSLRYGLISSEPEIWHSHRKMTARCFAYKTLPTYLNMINKHASSLVSDNPRNGDTFEGEDIQDLLSSKSIKIISEILVGANSRSEHASEILHHHVKGIKQLINYRLIHRPENSLAPIWWLNPKRRQFNKHIRALHNIIEADIDKCVEDAEKNKMLRVSSDKPFRSLIEEMLGANATLTEIQDEVATFFIAGHETNVCATNFFLQLIAENPEFQRLCQEEVDGLFNSKTDKYLSTDDLSQLKYLERCILETLRLAPAIPLYFRELTGPIQIDGFNFKKDSVICISPWTIHRNPKYFPSPEKFDSDRWLPENVSQRPACSFAAFSHGPRNCIGQKLAMMEMKVMLAWLLSAYDVQTTDKMNDLRIWFDATLAPERSFNITLRRRTR